MNTQQFWAIIDEARERAAGSCDAMLEPLVEGLSALDVGDLMRWQQIFDEYQRLSYKNKLWAAAYVIMGGCSDDSFDYFRAWLTAQGKDVYLSALRDPDTLAAVNTCRGDVSFEMMLGAAADAYSKKNDENHDLDRFYDELDKHNLTETEKAEIAAQIEYAKDIDDEWDDEDEDHLAKWLPRLSEIFSDNDDDDDDDDDDDGNEADDAENDNEEAVNDAPHDNEQRAQARKQNLKNLSWFLLLAVLSAKLITKGLVWQAIIPGVIALWKLYCFFANLYAAKKTAKNKRNVNNADKAANAENANNADNTAKNNTLKVENMKYDDCSWHINDKFPSDLPREAALTHTGMFMGWAIDAGLESELLKENFSSELQKFKNREITGSKFLSLCCDGKLTSDDFNDDGNLFAKSYYASDKYIGDYDDVCDDDCETIFHVKDSWENYQKVKEIIDKRYMEFKNRKTMKIEAYKNGNREEVAKFEKDFRVKLPEDYRNFLIEYNGGSVSDAYLYVEELDEHILMGKFFGIGVKEGFADIIEINEEYDEDIPKKSLLIGIDAGSGFILLINDGESDGIWYYDHTYFFDKSSDELNTYFICATFTDFIEMLETTEYEEKDDFIVTDEHKNQKFDIIRFTPDAKKYYNGAMPRQSYMDDEYVAHTEIDIPIGKSRYGGCVADLPEGVECPANMPFAAQLDLSEFAQFDKTGLLPKTGQLIVFSNFLEDTGKIFYADVANSELKRQILEHDENFEIATGIIIDKIFAETETLSERYVDDDGEIEYSSFEGSEKSKIFGIYTNCQLLEDEIAEIAFSSDKLVLLQIGEDGFNDEGVFSVLIDKEDLKNRNFDNCEFVWAQS